MLPLVFWSLLLGRFNTAADHFSKCETCSGYFDMRDLGAVRSRGAVATSGERSSAVEYVLSAGRADAAYAATFSEIQVLSPHWQSNM
jgi:hypothetical protein